MSVSDDVCLTHICGLLLRQFQFLLSILQGLRELVKLILCSLQFLLQSKQLILQLKEAKCDKESGRIQQNRTRFLIFKTVYRCASASERLNFRYSSALTYTLTSAC